MTKIRTAIRWISAAALAAHVVLLTGCTTDENGPIGTGEAPSPPPPDPGGSPPPSPTLTMGTAQKGPFINGAEVVITPLNALAEPSGSSINTQTIDDLGSFEFYAMDNTLYDISINGIYYNEVSGSLSTESLLLKAFFLNTPDKNNGVYVNVLTHIVYERIEFLIQNGQTPDSALTQAQNELLIFVHETLFVIETNNLTFHHLSLYNIDDNDDIGNAILLYMTATLYEYANLFYPGANSIELALNEVTNKFKDFDKISTSLDDLRDAALNINPITVRDNLINYSQEILGMALRVPDLNLVLDTDIDTIINNIDSDDDGDGIPDAEDSNPYRFEIFPEQNQTFTVSSGMDTEITLNFNIPKDRDFDIQENSPDVGSLKINDKSSNTILYEPSEDILTDTDQFTYKVASTYRVSPVEGAGEAEFISEEVTVLINVVP